MSREPDIHFSGARAAILHPAQTVGAQLTRRLTALGIEAQRVWPALEVQDFDVLFVDIDMGHDEQFPWVRGAAPMSVIGLIGSESPSRLTWALEQNMDGFLPQGALANVYSALVLASARHRERRALAQGAAETARRGTLRLEVIQAVEAIKQQDGLDTARALKKLRALAMVERCPLEDAALMLLGRTSERRSGGGGA